MGQFSNFFLTYGWAIIILVMFVFALHYMDVIEYDGLEKISQKCCESLCESFGGEIVWCGYNKISCHFNSSYSFSKLDVYVRDEEFLCGGYNE